MQKRAKRAEEELAKIIEELARIKKEQGIKDWEHDERLKNQKGILEDKSRFF